MTRRAVVSALFGGYETLREQPMAVNSSVPFICLTDDPSLVSDGWDVRLVEPAFPRDPVRSARAVKIRGHRELGELDEHIWVDNRVELRVPAERIFDELLADSDMTLFAHSFRRAAIEEFDAIAIGGYDDPARVYEQLIHYAETAPAVLDSQQLWTGLLVRRSTPAVTRAMEEWLDHVMRYSRRDQLSVGYALRSFGDRLRVLEGDNRESPWHRWPPLDPSLERDRAAPQRAFQEAIRAPLAVLHADRVSSQELIAALHDSARARDAVIADLRNQAAAAHARARRAEAEVQRLRQRRVVRWVDRVSGFGRSPGAS